MGPMDGTFDSFSVEFILKTAPGDGYGLTWNSGPLAVVSAPVLTFPSSCRPLAQSPL